MRSFLMAIVSACCALALASPLKAEHPIGKEMWVFWQNNLANDANRQELLELIDRAGPLGFTHLVISDTRSNFLGYLPRNEPETYPQFVQQIKDACAKHGMKIVPCVMDVGYSNGSLWVNGNWAEGSPVKDAPFMVKNGQADIDAAPLDLPAKPDVLEGRITYEDGIATITDNQSTSRLGWNLKLPRYRCYHVSLKIRTDGYSGTRMEIKPLAEGFGPLQYQHVSYQPTQDWTEAHIVFNTYDQEDVTLLLGIWGDARGTMQWKDITVQEAGLVNVLRRPGTPLEVKLVTDGTTQTLAEGEDYEPVADPKLGRVPWPGLYSVWHEAPKIRIKNTAKVPDGSRLLVNWYHPVITVHGQVGMCISEPAVVAHLEDSARRIQQLWGSEYYFLQHDEVRHLNHCKACTDRKMTTGQILAENIRHSAGLFNGATLFVWHDMFDPNHNATKNYWLAGDITGSWEGLPRDMVVIPWYHPLREKTMQFFADRGHPMLVSVYYDKDDPQTIRDWLETAKKHKNVRGVMYTTWAKRWNSIESFARHVSENRGD